MTNQASLPWSENFVINTFNFQTNIILAKLLIINKKKISKQMHLNILIVHICNPSKQSNKIQNLLNFDRIYFYAKYVFLVYGQ